MVCQKEISFNNGDWSLIDIKKLSEHDFNGAFSTITLLMDSYKLHLSDTEYFFIAGYDRMDNLKSVYLISKGNWNGSQFYEREVGVYMLLSHCDFFRLFHNHPNGALFGSKDDETIGFYTGRIANVFGLQCLGNYIVTKDGYCNIVTGEVEEFDLDI